MAGAREYTTSTVGRIITVAIVSFFATLGGFIGTRAALAHWSGFERNHYYCEGEYAGTTTGGVIWCGGDYVYHWGYNSAWHTDGRNHNGEYYYPSICADAHGARSGKIYFEGCSYSHARNCWVGYYPDCHDQDDIRLTLWMGPWRDNKYRHRFRAHGVG